MTSMTEGTVLINGKNMNEDFNEIISDIDFCPQNNIFLPDFTVFQQLLFFGLVCIEKYNFKNNE